MTVEAPKQPKTIQSPEPKITEPMPEPQIMEPPNDPPPSGMNLNEQIIAVAELALELAENPSGGIATISALRNNKMDLLVARVKRLLEEKREA